MNFDLTEDQAMLKDTAERLFAEAADGAGVWARMAEMGLLAAPLPRMTAVWAWGRWKR